MDGVSESLFLDLYELTMTRAYAELGMQGQAVFSLSVRRLPESRNYLVACGLDTFLEQLENFRFGKPELDYIASLGMFPDSYLRWLENFRFEGDVFAVAEGAPVFANEPLLEVIAPIAQGQIIETLAINQIGLQTLLASKGARMVEAAGSGHVIDFGSRRAHGLDSGLKGARAFYIAGASATSNVEAGRLYGIPVAGTVAHSFIEAFDSEAEAFENFVRIYPGTTLLVDTYDTIGGVKRVVELSSRLGDAFRIDAIRIDSGDLLSLSMQAREMLDAASLQHVRIVASGGLDEMQIQNLVQAGAPFDAFGVGTDMSVSGDAPSIDIAYKLTEYEGRGRMKLSTGKRTLPGRKQVFREYREGLLLRDQMARHDETCPGTPLLECVMRAGRRLRPPLALAAIAAHARDQRLRLPPPLRALTPAPSPFEPAISPKLEAAERDIRANLAAQARSQP